jgi:mediator of RNA polymerase II transcription subunit 7
MNENQLYPDPIPTGAEFDGQEGQKSQPEYSLDRVKYLKRTVRSLLLNFLELIDVLSEDPVESETKLKDLTTLFLNAHMMVNEYRPHQARETLILMMEDEIERKRGRIAEIQEVKRKMDGMDAVVQGIQRDANGAKGVHREVKKKGGIWEELKEIDDGLSG